MSTKRIGVFFGSSTGTTAEEAGNIARAMGVAEKDVHDVAATAPSSVGNYDVLIFGTSTWGDGRLESDWYDFLDGIEVLDLKDKIIALFGCGDESMSRTFCNGVGELYDRLQRTGAWFIGAYPADCYDFEHTSAIRDGLYVGLLLDDVNRPELSPDRVAGWTTQLKGELAD
ncbi:MAG: flavodoxin [Clostridium sp.]|nr:flavodoxin [Clostridium sp.]